MSCQPQSSSSAPSCGGAQISVGQGSGVEELPPQASATTNPWGPAWLWGNAPAAPNLPIPIMKAQHCLAASPSSPKPWLPWQLTARGFTMEHVPKEGDKSGPETPKVQA